MARCRCSGSDLLVVNPAVESRFLALEAENALQQQQIQDLTTQITESDATSHWNTAWGLIATSAPITAQVDATYPATPILTRPLSATLLAGRRYRYVMRIQAVQPLTAPGTGNPLGVAVAIRRTGTGTIIEANDQWIWVAGQYSGGTVESLHVGDGAVWAVEGYVRIVNATAGSVRVFPKGLELYDVGPVVGAPVVPNPAPAWNHGGGFVSNVSGTTSQAWIKQGTVCHFIGGFTGQVTGTPVQVTLPLPAAAFALVTTTGQVYYRDTAISYYQGIALVENTTTVSLLNTTGFHLTPTNPFTWGAGDQGYWNITYEVDP